MLHLPAELCTEGTVVGLTAGNNLVLSLLDHLQCQFIAMTGGHIEVFPHPYFLDGVKAFTVPELLAYTNGLCLCKSSRKRYQQ